MHLPAPAPPLAHRKRPPLMRDQHTGTTPALQQRSKAKVNTKIMKMEVMCALPCTKAHLSTPIHGLPSRMLL